MIKVSDNSKRFRVKNRPVLLKSFYTNYTRQRRQEGKKLLFIDETYLDYERDNLGLWSIKVNSWT